MNNYFWESLKIENKTGESRVISKKSLLIIRIIFLLILLEANVWALIKHFDGYFKMYRFLTFWGLAMSPIIYICLIICTIYSMKSTPAPSFLWKFAHSQFECWMTIEFTIAVLFWLIVYPTESHDGIGYYILNVQAHGIIFIFGFIDAAFNRIVFYDRHFIITSLWNVVYMAGVNLPIALLYKPPYAALTWKN